MTRSPLAFPADFGLLRSVAADDDLDAEPAVFELRFEHAVLRLVADSAWDTLEVTVVKAPDASLREVSNPDFWADVLGTVLTWS